jgi:hypothetical protein
MKRWIVPVAGGGVAAALLAVGVLAAVHDGPRAATAQVPTTVPPGSTASATPGGPRTVTVDGVGVVTGIPDTVTVNLGVSVDRGSAADALQAASSKANALIATLTAAGVAKTDIQTGYVSVWPHYDNGSTPDGYSASNSVTAVIHDVSRAGPVIDAATDAVGDGITLGGVSFSIDDTSDLYGQARQSAVKEAKGRAAQLAQAAGVSVGAVLSMNESAQAQPNPYDRAAAATTAAAGGSAPTPIEPGSQQLQLRVQVVFELVG